MKNGNKRVGVAAFLAATAVTLLSVGTPDAARAQGPGAPAAPARISLDANAQDLENVLLDLFRQAGVTDYSIADDVSGPLTLRLTDRPFEDALSLIARSARPPLTWNKADGVYSVKRRVVAPPEEETGGIASDPPVITASGERYEMLYPVYADTQNLLRALELLQPAGLTAAFAYPPTNGLLVRFGGPGPLVTGVIGATAGGAPAGQNNGAPGPAAGQGNGGGTGFGNGAPNGANSGGGPINGGGGGR